MGWNGPDPRRAAFKKAGLCAVCGRNEPKTGRVTCPRCLKRQAAYNEARKKKLVEEECGRLRHDRDREKQVPG